MADLFAPSEATAVDVGGRELRVRRDRLHTGTVRYDVWRPLRQLDEGAGGVWLRDAQGWWKRVEGKPAQDAVELAYPAEGRRRIVVAGVVLERPS